MFKKILHLNGILFFRFFGLFLVLPLISIHAQKLEEATPTLVGIVIGGYALTQAVFQIPFGILSDKFGRKWLIIFGLILFFIGSLISGLADDIYTLIIGRFIQGAGAIGSVVSASVTDFVREEERGKAMAIIGGSIAMAFAFAMVIGSTVGAFYGVNILFFITSGLAIVSIIFALKITEKSKIELKFSNASHDSILKNQGIGYLLFTSFIQKGLMSIIFMMIPMILTSKEFGFGWEKEELWHIYIPAMILGILMMGPAVILGEKRNKPKILFLTSSALTILVAFLISSKPVIALFLFFIAFNLIEPLIQSMVSKLVRSDQRGKALGYTNSMAYIGTFAGGTFAGMFLHNSKIEIFQYILAGLAGIWFLWSLIIKNPIPKGNVYLDHSQELENKIDDLISKNIIFEWYINRNENLIVIKYIKSHTSENEIRSLLNV